MLKWGRGTTVNSYVLNCTCLRPPQKLRSKWRYFSHPYCHALRTTENRSEDSIVVILTFKTLRHLDNKNRWEKVSRLITKMSLIKLKKTARLPRAINPLRRRVPRSEYRKCRWLVTMQCCWVEFGVRTRLLGHLSNFYYSPLWVSSDNQVWSSS